MAKWSFDLTTLRFKICQTSDEIDRAREMAMGLVQSGDWPPPHDPSGLQIKIGPNGKPRLVDFFDHCSTYCVLEYDSGETAGVWRLTRVARRACPLTVYFPSTPPLPDFLERSFQATRYIVDPPLRGTGASLMLLQGAFRWIQAQTDATHVFTTVEAPKPAINFMGLGLKKLAVPEFRYWPTEPRPSWLLYTEVNDGIAILDGLLSGRPLAA